MTSLCPCSCELSARYLRCRRRANGHFSRAHGYVTDCVFSRGENSAGKGAFFASISLQNFFYYNIMPNAPHTSAESRSFRKVAATGKPREVKTKKEA